MGKIELDEDDLINILESNGWIVTKQASCSDDIDDDVLPKLDGIEMLKYLKRLFGLRDWHTKDDVMNVIKLL